MTPTPPTKTEGHDLPCLCDRCRRVIARERKSQNQPDDMLRRLALLVEWATALENRGARTLGEVTKRFVERRGVAKSSLYRIRDALNRRGLAGLADGRAGNGGHNKKTRKTKGNPQVERGVSSR